MNSHYLMRVALTRLYSDFGSVCFFLLLWQREWWSRQVGKTTPKGAAKAFGLSHAGSEKLIN